MTFPRIASLALPLAAVVVGCAAPDSQAPVVKTRLGSSQSAVQEGSETIDHPFAVGIFNRIGAVCTGTLIAPNLVLTARHCVVEPDGSEAVSCEDTFRKELPVEYLYVTTSPQFSRDSRFYPVTSLHVPAATGFCGNDIALMVLGKNVPASEATPAIPVIEFPLTDARLSRQVAVLGYGITSPTAEDSGLRRIREHVGILCIPGDATGRCDDVPGLAPNDSEFVTEGGVCSGDSGGGAFDQKTFDAGGAPYVLGTLSRGPQTETECLAAVYTRTDSHKDLIIQTAALAAKSGGYDAPSWTGLAPSGEPRKALGAGCDVDADCESGACKETLGGAKTCTAACTDDTACNDGFVCREELCVAAETASEVEAAAQPKTVTKTTSLCSMGVATRGTSGGVALVVAAVAAAVGRRRRRA